MNEAGGAASAIQVTIESGTLEGSVHDGVAAYLGIPYAAPPVGPLRWRPPQPVQSWQGVRRADRYGPDPIQPPQTMHGSQPQSEDCLYLNVWAPAGVHQGAGLPVMFFIHGGGFKVGSGSLSAYNGKYFARRGVVLVTINYRLGTFGFFAHPALTRESPDSPTGNYGVMDMLAALQWVKRNVAAFGGNPENVTIFGESAGGMAVNYLMMSKAARGLFHRAIVQSGGGRFPMPTFQQAEEQGQATAEGWGVKEADAAALRAVPAATVLGNATGMSGGGSPMIDGTFVPELTLEAFEGGRIARVPYMVGTNSFETGFFPGMAKGLSERLTEHWSRITVHYDGYGTRETAMIEEEVMGDVMMTAPARALARAAAKAGLPTYLYRFSYLRPAQRGTVPGALHVDEIYAVFGTMDALIDDQGTLEPNDPEDTRNIVDALQLRWVAFARTGQPDDPATWPPYDLETEHLLEFTQDGHALHRGLHRERLDLVDALPPG